MSNNTDNSNPPAAPKRRNHGFVAVACLTFVVAMVGASYAAVPLYYAFCRATGFNGTTQVGTTAPTKIVERRVTVRFDANVAPGLDWEFGPEQRQVDVAIGATTMVMFRATNRSNESTWANALYNVLPEQTGAYFTKLQCFCFEEQMLRAGETAEMPVVFYIDPSMVDDHELDRTKTITLSYTLFPAKPPASVADAGKAGKGRL